MIEFLRTVSAWTTILGILATAVISQGCRTSEPVFSNVSIAGPDGQTSSMTDNRILQVGDLVILRWPAMDNPHEERIKEDGTITLPLIGSIDAAGKTEGELCEELADKYPQFRGWNKREELVYSIEGEVRSPGPKPYLGKTTISRAIQAAGGFTKSAKTEKVKLRHADGRVETVKLGKTGEDSTYDPSVFPGESIIVERHATEIQGGRLGPKPYPGKMMTPPRIIEPHKWIDAPPNWKKYCDDLCQDSD